MVESEGREAWHTVNVWAVFFFFFETMPTSCGLKWGRTSFAYIQIIHFEKNNSSPSILEKILETGFFRVQACYDNMCSNGFAHSTVYYVSTVYNLA